MKLVRQVVRQPERGFTPAVAQGATIVAVDWDHDVATITWLTE